jgi:DNA-binding transcriptional regulator GbsR (MarR family)
MQDDTETILRSYIERAGQMFENFGFPRLSGEIGALLYLYNGPLSLNEISEFLEISKGSASTNTRALERMKFIRVMKMRGDRKDYYEFSGSLWPALKASLDNFMRNQVDDFKNLNKENIGLLKEKKGKDRDDVNQRQHMQSQLKDLDTLYKYMGMMGQLTEMFREKPHGVIHKTLKKLLRT